MNKEKINTKMINLIKNKFEKYFQEEKIKIKNKVYSDFGYIKIEKGNKKRDDENI